MTVPQVLLLVGMIVLVDVVIVSAVFKFSASIWNSLGKNCGSVEPSPGAVRKDFQSIKVGVFNFGACAHIAVDEDHLHMYPAWIVRASGGHAFSIPWSLVVPDASHPARRTWPARINGQRVQAPAWAMRIAAAGAERARDADAG
jgi:hypothetical protein